MKNIKTAIATIAFAASLATAAQAAELAALKGQKIDLGAVNGVAYYTVEKDGYRVVATLADTDSKSVRFEAVLAPGQTVVVSSPSARGQQAARIEISRKADRVEVVEATMTN